LLVSVLDEVTAILSSWRPATIYPPPPTSVPDQAERLDGLKNNIFGTEIVARLAAERERRRPDQHRQGRSPRQCDGRQQAPSPR
jgi:hypothetical protein